MATEPNAVIVPKWGKFETRFERESSHRDALREVELSVTFFGPNGKIKTIAGFWDGGRTWCVRFSPDAEGEWSYKTACTGRRNASLHERMGRFRCVAPLGKTRFARHGPVRLSLNRRYLEHEDGTPFLWLADTAWNGPLLAEDDDWKYYLAERTRQKFTAVHWVATQWLASPEGDRSGAKAFSGIERIEINPAFFQRLDAKLYAIEEAGLLNVPVLLWAAEWSTPEANALNPGVYLPEDQAILLAKYMVARWSATPVVWVLPGDGSYEGEKAERWRRIGRAVFGEGTHAPVVLHPAGMQSYAAEFQSEPWLDLLGYQSGHGDDADTLRWLVSGPLAVDWRRGPARPVINLEPPYEDHLAYHSQTRIDANFVRRALYWSLLVCPTAGVTYGAHGVWGWDDGTRLTAGHPTAGLPKSWKAALKFLGAEQVGYLAAIFDAIEWWTLRPSSELLSQQSGSSAPERFVAAASSSDGRLAVLYVPSEQSIEIRPPRSSEIQSALWHSPRDGSKTPASERTGNTFTTPGSGDWVLILRFNF